MSKNVELVSECIGEISHVNNIAGEASCLKGLQGAKGYRFSTCKALPAHFILN